jgi:hypothetical protein
MANGTKYSSVLSVKIQQERPCTCKVILRRVRVTIAAVLKL